MFQRVNALSFLRYAYPRVEASYANAMGQSPFVEETWYSVLTTTRLFSLLIKAHYLAFKSRLALLL